MSEIFARCRQAAIWIGDRLTAPSLSRTEMEARMLTHLRLHGRTSHRDLNRLFTRGPGRHAPRAPVHLTGVILHGLAEDGYVTSDSEPRPADGSSEVYWSPTGRRAPARPAASDNSIAPSAATA